MKRKGFTLIELFVVICIVVILFAIIAPIFFLPKGRITQVTVSQRSYSNDNTYFITTPTGDVYDLDFLEPEDNARVFAQIKENCVYSIKYIPKTKSQPAKIKEIIAEIGCR